MLLHCSSGNRADSACCLGAPLHTSARPKAKRTLSPCPRRLSATTPQEEIYSSSYAAAAYLESIHFPKDKKVYVIGETGILEELQLKSISYLGGPEDGQKVVNLKPGEYMEHDEDVSALCVGGGLGRVGGGGGALRRRGGVGEL